MGKRITVERAATLLKEHYGVATVEIKELFGYDDQNFIVTGKLKDKCSQYVFKVTDNTESNRKGLLCGFFFRFFVFLLQTFSFNLNSCVSVTWVISNLFHRGQAFVLISLNWVAIPKWRTYYVCKMQSDIIILSCFYLNVDLNCIIPSFRHFSWNL